MWIQPVNMRLKHMQYINGENRCSPSFQMIEHLLYDPKMNKSSIKPGLLGMLINY